MSKVLLLTTLLPFTFMHVQASSEDETVRACCTRKAKNPCAPTPITAITTITSSGVYCLANDILGAGPLITIASSDVCLDLNSHVLTAVSADAILFDTTHHRDNITIANGHIDGSATGGSSGATGVNGINIGSPVALPVSTHIDITLSNLLVRDFVGAGLLVSGSGAIATVGGLAIDNCVFTFNDVNVSVFCSNGVNAQNSSFSGSVTGEGALFSSCGEVSLSNCSFYQNNTNGLTFVGSDICTQATVAHVNDCSFSFNNACGFLSATTTDVNLQSFDLEFARCSFDENLADGACVGGASGVIFAECSAFRNGDNGFTFTGSTYDVLLENCAANLNTNNGFTFATVAGQTNVVGCIAKENKAVGFDASQSTNSGVFKGCTADGNSVCGFVDRSAGLAITDPVISRYQYIQNVSQNNGTNPAGSVSPVSLQDTNYCLLISGVSTPTGYNSISGGPGNQLPYRQFGRNAGGLFTAGAWDNITLQ